MRNFTHLIGLSLLIALAIPVAGCGDDAGPPIDMPGDGDGDGDQPGDGDGDGDQPGDGDGDGDDDRCDVDSVIPHDCGCNEDDAPCFEQRACVTVADKKEECWISHDSGVEPEVEVDGGHSGDDGGAGNLWCEDRITCDDVCGLGKCAENGCGGNTWLYSPDSACARPGDYGGGKPARCDSPIGFTVDQLGEWVDVAVTCCCIP